MDSKPQSGREVVVLLYGLGGVRPLLLPLARALRRAGLEPRTWPYLSWVGDLEEHVGRLSIFLRQLDAEPTVSVIHCVGHSMGAIIVRAALARDRPSKLGRVVFLAPPHRGSRIADLLESGLGRVLRFIPQLSTRPESFVNQLAALPDIDFGVIAASHDHMVTVDATVLEGQADHHVLRSLHTVILHRDVGRLVINFLRNGRFDAEASRPPAQTQR